MILPRIKRLVRQQIENDLATGHGTWRDQHCVNKHWGDDPSLKIP